MASIRLTKTGSFEARVWLEGKRHSQTFDTRRKAEHWASGIECGQLKPTTLASCKAKAKKDELVGMSLAQGLELYWAQSVSRQKGAAKARYRIIELQRETFSRKPIALVSVEDVRSLKTRELARGCSEATVFRKLAILSAFFTYVGTEWDGSIENPVKPIKKVVPSNRRVRRISLENERALLQACTQSKTRYLSEVVILALETGMRRGELLGCAWDDVDFQRGLITLAETKNGHPRYVPLTEQAATILAAVKAAGAERPAPIALPALESAWKRAVARSGVVGVRFHDLRHEALSRWAHKLNGDVFKLAMVSGHRSLEMARRYVAPTLAELLLTVSSSSNVSNGHENLKRNRNADYAKTEVNP